MKHLYLLILPFVLVACNQSAPKVTTVVINEICGKDADGLEWVEVANASSEAINLKGYKLIKMDDEGIEKTLYTFGDTIIAPGAIMTINKEQLKAKIPSTKAIIVELLNPNKETVDYFDSDETLDADGHPEGGSYARVPNASGNWAITTQATWNAPNEANAPTVTDEELDLDDFDEDDD